MASFAHTQATFALASAMVRYRLAVAAVARCELVRWQREAEQIEDSRLRSLAIQKLKTEGFNATAATMLATMRPRRQRSDAVRAIVALEVMFDYLDGRTEMPVNGDPVEQRRVLFEPLMAAVGERASARDAHQTDDGDARYLSELARVASQALAHLDQSPPALARMLGACERAIEAQARIHAVGDMGTTQLEQWARIHQNGSQLGWREYVGGAAASVLAVHALIATGGNDQSAARLDEAYLYVGALATLLDGVVDQARDSQHGVWSYCSLFCDPVELQQALLEMTREACKRAQALEHGAQHLMVIGGLLAYYTTAPGAASKLARPAINALETQHGGLMAPPTLVLRAWRRAQERSNGH
jgi:tetraprenyl-beta-curcumene synthase